MESHSIILIICILILVLFSAFFSSTETAFSSLNKIRLKNMASSGNKRAEHTLRLSERFDEILSTLLIGNNIVNITMASLGTILFTIFFAQNGVTISTIVITIVVLIFGEITPKSLAKENPEKFAIFATPILRFFMVILCPLTFIFKQWKKLLSKLFKVNDSKQITEDELITFVDEAQNEGGIDEHEGKLIRAAIEFNDVDASDILTPRVDIEAVELTDSMEEIARVFRESGFSRLPIYKGTIDHIVGVIHEKGFHKCRAEGFTSIESAVSEVAYTTENTKISNLLRLLQSNKTHMAIVVDEFGGTVGIITMEDILEELVGDIWDEHDEVIEDFQKTGENTYRILCSADLEDMLELFHIDEEFDCATVSGWVVQTLGKIPSVGDHFTYENLDITVTTTDMRRVLGIEVKVTPRPDESSGDEKRED